MAAKRAGYTISSYLVDVSPSMDVDAEDAQTGEQVKALELVKEYVSRKIAPKIQSGRKTDHAALITFGGETDNPYFSGEGEDAAGERDPNDYIGVASVFPPQQARPAMLGALQDVRVGDKAGNPIAALFVADELIRQHKVPNKSGSWRREVVILTSSNAKLKQGGWEDAMQMIQEQNVVLRVIGVGYDERETEEIPEEELKKLPKSERFWRTFCQKLTEAIPEGNEYLYPALGSISQALSVARAPALDIPNSTLTASRLRIGDREVDDAQAIDFAVRWSKGTSIARPMTLKKVLASQGAKVLPRSVTASQAGPSQSQTYTQGGTIQGGDIQPYTKYVMTKRKPGADADGMNVDGEEIQEEEVDKDNLVKAYKFGSTWVPLNDEDFEPMVSIAGMDVLGFMPRMHYRRYQSMGEMYYIWPDPESIKDQLQMSALVQALEIKDQFALLRWAQKETSAPRLGAAWPKIDEDGVCYLAWVQLPFAEDERTFLFPSLTKLMSKKGHIITEHKLLPTDDQLLLMDEFVEEMDLDSLAEENDGIPWYQPQESYNPAIHRLKDAVYHQAVTADLDADPMPPPHPLLTQYLNTPESLIKCSSDTVDKLKTALDIKSIPPPIKRADAKAARAAGSAEEIDIEALFAAKPEPSYTGAKKEESGTSASKPADGRVISNETPLEDLKRELSREGTDNTAKVLRDLGAVIKENISASFSTAAFPLALDCLREMREQAMILEEVDLYHAYIQDLESFVTAPKFKHRDFWNHVTRAKPPLGKISEAEAEAALQ